MKKFIYVFDEETKSKLINKGFRLLKGDSKPFIFANDNNVKFDDMQSKSFMLSDIMQF